MAAAEDKYVCQLDAASIEKAKKELNEDPKDRLGAVEALRTWIQQQPHITYNPDTLTLLYFLRTSKFSQLRARTMIENYIKAFTNFSHWFMNIDTLDPDIVEVLDSGRIFPLPKREMNGCCVMMNRPGVTKENGEMFSVTQEMRAASSVFGYAGRDENVQVNGFVFVLDLSGVGPKHMTRWNMEDMRKWHACWQTSLPGRYKSFHYYNAGAIFEALMTIFRPMISKKMQDRIRVHDTMESLYKAIGMEILPDEYLPDDYTGPSAGPIKQIVANLKADMTEEKFRQMLMERTSPQQLAIDESKRPAVKPVAESFRKLAVD